MRSVEQAFGDLGAGREANLRAGLLYTDRRYGARPEDALAQVRLRRVTEEEVGESSDEGVAGAGGVDHVLHLDARHLHGFGLRSARIDRALRAHRDDDGPAELQQGATRVANL